MKFDSNTGREAGKKSKRGKSKTIEEMRSMVKDLVEKNIDQIEKDLQQLEPKDRLDCLTRLMRYVMPTLKATEVKEVSERTHFRALELSFDEQKAPETIRNYQYDHSTE